MESLGNELEEVNRVDTIGKRIKNASRKTSAPPNPARASGRALRLKMAQGAILGFSTQKVGYKVGYLGNELEKVDDIGNLGKRRRRGFRKTSLRAILSPARGRALRLNLPSGAISRSSTNLGGS